MCEVKQKEQVIPAHDWFAMLEPLLHDGCELKISPAGMSMYPFLVGGRDEVFLCSKLKKPAKRGDICLYLRDDQLFILHRIHHINQLGYFMLGDAQTGIEGPIPKKHIRATATAVIWRGKKIPCNRWWLRCLVEIWLWLRPIRPYIMRGYSRLSHIVTSHSVQ